MDMVSNVLKEKSNIKLNFRNQYILKQMVLSGLDQETFKETLDMIIDEKLFGKDFEAQYMQEADDTLKEQFKNFCAIATDDFKSKEEKEAARDTFAQSYINAVKQRYITNEASEEFKNMQAEGLDDIFGIDDAKRRDYKKGKELEGKDIIKERFEKAEKNLAGAFADEKYGAKLKASYDKLKQLHKAAFAGENNENAMNEEKERFLSMMNKINVKNLATLISLRKVDDDKWMEPGNSSFQEAMGETIQSKMWTVTFKMGFTKATSMISEHAWDSITSMFG